MGSCTAGGAYVPAMTDETIIVRGAGHDLPRRPAAGEGGDGRGDLAPRNWAARDTHARKSGVVDHVAENDEHALTIVRDIVSTLAAAGRCAASTSRSRARRSSTPRSCTASSRSDVRAPYDVHEVIARLVDGSEFHEFKALYGTTLVCGFAHIWGMPVAILANNGVLFSRKRAEGRAFHRARLPAAHAVAVPAEHLGLHGRRQI